MKVERYTNFDQQVTIRVMDTVCPKCKKHVQFAMRDDEYVESEIDQLNKWIVDLQATNERLNRVIDSILEKRL